MSVRTISAKQLVSMIREAAEAPAYKRGSVVSVPDPDGHGSTKARVVSVDGNWLTVKWLDFVWDLKNDSLIHRKGSTSRVSVSQVKTSTR